ncbi:NUDIX hydrolase domain-like protein [Mycena rosella]|uniref:NUDIX hydrolase domain-like protein n=1 Tax=Mycena rosella TaxID=1033263 RepID=A0AAD7FQN7_MYCRO|nr:NUDIX hydrolase domain-like protein [Mycena rosella]
MSDKAPKPLNLLEYHRPKRIKLSDARIPPLSAESKRCLRNLAAYRPPKQKIPYPRSRSAAVLVALFVGRLGDLYVLLNRRSASLRSYAGDTSLPGGKVDPEDRTIEDTARREAFEEIGLPRNKLKVPLLCILEPFMASNQLVVTPVVVLILDNTLRPILNTAEVASLFSHPLASFLSSSPPFPTEPELVEVPYHTAGDWTYEGPNGVQHVSRAHRFLTGREAGGIKPVFGLTAAILIKAASIAHARLPDFEVAHPEGQTSEARIAWAVYSNPAFRKAYEAEGIRVNWGTVARLAGVKAGEAVHKDKEGRQFERRATRATDRSAPRTCKFDGGNHLNFRFVRTLVQLRPHDD